MTSSISIQYQNSTFSAATASIQVATGTGQFVLASNEFLSMNGTFTFSTFSVSSNSVNFNNTSTGVTVNGTISIPVNTGSSGPPVITGTNFQNGTVTLMWPSTTGPQYQVMSSGDPITLTNFTG